MANLRFTTILLLCLALLRVNGQSNSSILPSSTTIPSTSSTTLSTNDSQSTNTSTPPSAKPPTAKGKSTPSSTKSPPAQGAQVNTTIYVRVPTCSGVSYEDVSSSQYKELESNLKGNITAFYTRDGVTFVLNTNLRSAQCTGSHVKVVVTITFTLGIEFKIKEDIKSEIKNNFLRNLPVNGTLVEVAFIGVEILFNIKNGECKRVCCDGAGGPVYMVSSCKSQTTNNSSCDGFKSEEKQEEDHCPGEAKDLCTSTCDRIGAAGDRAGSVHFASFAILGLLAVATFFKFSVC